MPWRGILFYSFVAFFFIAGIVLLLYGTGYRYSPGKQLFEKTGELIAESMPKGASVFLDGRDTGKKTPAHIKYILPGKYSLTVRKDGYLPFAKEIVVAPGIVLVSDDIVFVRDTIPTVLFTYPELIQEFLTITSKFIFFKTKSVFSAYDRAQGMVRELVRANEPLTVLVSPDSKSFYVYSKNSAFVVKGNAMKAISAFSPSAELLQTPAWSNEERLYGITAKGILEYSPLTGETKYIAKGVFRDISFQNGFINAIQQRNEIVSFVQYSLGNRPTEKKRYDITKTAVRFVKNSEPFILFETEANEFAQLEQNVLQLPEQIRGIQKLVSPNDARAVAVSEFEVWLFSSQGKQKSLILRQSKPIVKAVFVENTPYVLVENDDSLELVEISDSFSPSRYEIFLSLKLEDSFLSQKEKKIFFSVSGAKGSRVYERLLVD